MDPDEQNYGPNFKFIVIFSCLAGSIILGCIIKKYIKCKSRNTGLDEDLIA